MPKVDENIIALLCCPSCKGQLVLTGETFVCQNCKGEYEKIPFMGSQQAYTYDFRIHRPTYCVSSGFSRYSNVQKMYERYHRSISTRDDLKVYLDEIDSVKEIYTKEFSIKGRVLDIGGHQGRLRHYLNDSAVSFYISVDPFISVFEGIESHTNLLKAYPSLLKPCNFLACHAEYLPFETRSFDFVHMRSVLDHFQDPYLALREAYRVLVEGGEMLVGLSVEGRRLSMSGILHGKRLMVLRFYEKLKREGLQVTKRIPKVISGRDHMFHWKYSDLIDLLGKTKFRIIKEHWQKPPFDMCIYILAGKQSTP